jgi:hypothetical protein
LNYNTGEYIIENKEKYIGTKNPKYRSSWEKRVCYMLDKHPSILKWSYEAVIIPYISPVDNRPHKYIMDFYAEIKDRNGVIKKYLLEVKPAIQGPKISADYKFDYSNKPNPPKIRNQKAQIRFMNEVKTYAVNTAKWMAAINVCKSRGLDFMIITENDIQIPK